MAQDRIYLAGSLRNPAMPSIRDALAEACSMPVFMDWYAAGPHADDHWKEYYDNMGLSYPEALRMPASLNTFWFDKKNIDVSACMVLALPAGKSGHLELGYHLGKGRPGFILLEEENDRWDVMYQFATGVYYDVDGIAEHIRELKRDGEYWK
jgi:nucleoside 2-deoxyribosyltransferase